MQSPHPLTPASRLDRIAQARQMALLDAAPVTRGLIAPWIEDAWQRCLNQGQRPEQHLSFKAVSSQTMRQASECNRNLVQAARPVLQQLGAALAATRYFAILTNQDGVVVDVDGPIDRSDRRVDLITRVGTDLSEPSVGTTAIGAALRLLQPVWLHRGEHFFNDTSAYSCAGAPLFGPDGRCVGMLDLTGVEATERPELRHLVAHSARNIENALVLQRPHTLLLRLNWPGLPLGSEGDGLLGLDADGFVTAANQAARQMLPPLVSSAATHHSRDLFALPSDLLFDAARHSSAGLDVPLWSGLRLQVQARMAQRSYESETPIAWLPSQLSAPTSPRLPLKDVETAMILKAVDEARGNVAEAAMALGISRATVYRKLGSGKLR
jgi:sigma-54 dependent transcriptional regulator, acetoin dehydrogenase operon transcriptional activator AcoR